MQLSKQVRFYSGESINHGATKSLDSPRLGVLCVMFYSGEVAGMEEAAPQVLRQCRGGKQKIASLEGELSQNYGAQHRELHL